MAMHKARVKMIEDRIMGLVKDILKKEFGVLIYPDGGSLGWKSATLRFEVQEPVDGVNLAVTDEDVKRGFAPTGTVVLCSGRKFTIIKPRKAKYLGTAEDGSQYLLRFTSCSLVAKGGSK